MAANTTEADVVQKARKVSSKRPDRAPGTGEGGVKGLLLGILAWFVALFFFFPIFWMVLNSFKEELDANTDPKLFFDPTLDRYRAIRDQATNVLTAGEAFTNSVIVVGVSTILVMVLAIPAAYALSIKPIAKAKDVLFFFISTKFLPLVGIILPVWLIAGTLGLRGSRIALIILYMGLNLPLAVWMLRSFFREVPKELIEAAQIDGASLFGQIRSVILPIVAPGLAATALLSIIFAWNEFFFALQINVGGSETVPLWVVGNIQAQGLFLAQISAASTLATLPVVLAGWIAQKRMIRGLALGAIK